MQHYVVGEFVCVLDVLVVTSDEETVLAAVRDVHLLGNLCRVVNFRGLVVECYQRVVVKGREGCTEAVM